MQPVRLGENVALHAPEQRADLQIAESAGLCVYPKAAAVYLTLAPQFLTAREVGLPSMLALATVHVLIMVVWLGVWSVALSGARRLTQFPGFRTWVNRAGGAVLVALGVRTAVTAA